MFLGGISVPWITNSANCIHFLNQFLPFFWTFLSAIIQAKLSQSPSHCQKFEFPCNFSTLNCQNDLLYFNSRQGSDWVQSGLISQLPDTFHLELYLNWFQSGPPEVFWLAKGYLCSNLFVFARHPPHYCINGLPLYSAKDSLCWNLLFHPPCRMFWKGLIDQLDPVPFCLIKRGKFTDWGFSQGCNFLCHHIGWCACLV